MAPTKTSPRISVLDRRLQNPFGEPSLPVSLKDSSLRARWFNAAIVTDKIWRAKQKGWTPLKVKDLVDHDQIGGYTEGPDGIITRGDRGQEVLMAMSQSDYAKIEAAKSAWNNRNMGSSARTKAEVVEAASQQLGDEAADFLNRASRPVGSVVDSYERVQRTEE